MCSFLSLCSDFSHLRLNHGKADKVFKVLKVSRVEDCVCVRSIQQHHVHVDFQFVSISSCLYVCVCVYVMSSRRFIYFILFYFSLDSLIRFSYTHIHTLHNVPFVIKVYDLFFNDRFMFCVLFFLLSFCLTFTWICVCFVDVAAAAAVVALLFFVMPASATALIWPTAWS